MIDVEQFDPVDPGLVQQFEVFARYFVARLDINLAGRFVNQVIGRIATEDLLGRNQQIGKAILGGLVGGARRNLLPAGEYDFAGLGVDDVVHRLLTAPIFCLERNDPATLAAHKGDAVVEMIEDFLAR